LRIWLNKSQIEDWFGLWHVFGAISFKWNSVFCPKWHRFIHYLKKTQTVLFRMALWVSFFPWTCEAGEEEEFSPLLFPLPLSPKPSKRHRQKLPNCLPCGGTGNPAPLAGVVRVFPPIFTYKYRGGSSKEKRRGEERQKREQNRGKKKKTKKKEKKKTEENRERKRSKTEGKREKNHR